MERVVLSERKPLTPERYAKMEAQRDVLLGKGYAVVEWEDEGKKQIVGTRCFDIDLYREIEAT